MRGDIFFFHVAGLKFIKVEQATALLNPIFPYGVYCNTSQIAWWETEKNRTMPVTFEASNPKGLENFP